MAEKRERVLNALQKQEVDCVPVGFWYHFRGKEAQGEDCVQAHLKYYRETDLDFLKVMCDGFFTFPIPDRIQKAKDWFTLEPLRRDHPFIQDQLWRAKRIVEEIGRERCIFYNVYAPFSSIRFGYGEEKVMQHIREDKEAVKYALDIIAQTNALLAQLMVEEAGCDGIYFCVQGGERFRFSEDEYREVVRPSDLYVLEHANRFSKNNIIPCCGWAGAQNHLEAWRDYPASCFNWAVYVEGLSLHDGRNYFGDKAILGGFETLHLDEAMTQCGLLYTGTKDEIQTYTRELILQTGKRGLLLGGDCTISSYLDHERIRWVVEAARQV